MEYKIIWDNPYSMFCNKGKVVSPHDGAVMLNFNMDRKEDTLSFYDNNGCTKWLWLDRYKGIMIDNDNNILVRTDGLKPNKTRKDGAINCTLFMVHTAQNYYMIEWKTTLWFNLISNRDIMTLVDADKQILFQSITPSLYKFSIVKPSDENELLAKVFVAYHIKIPMQTIGG